MKVLNVVTRNEDTVTVTYHWDRDDPEKFCSKIKSLLPEEDGEEVKPSGPETAADVVRSQEIALLRSGQEIIQGPWSSTNQIRETLSKIIDSTHPEFHQTWAHCRDCLC